MKQQMKALAYNLKPSKKIILADNFRNRYIIKLCFPSNKSQ